MGEQNRAKIVQEVIVDNMRTTLEDASTLLTVAESLASEGAKWVQQEVTSAVCNQVTLSRS